MIALAAALLLAGTSSHPQLTAELFVTNQPGTVLMRWGQGQRVELASVQTVRRGEPVAALVLFSGCAGDQQGRCNLDMDIEVLDPSGKVYGQSKKMEVWVKKAPPPTGTSQLSVDYMMIEIEPKDPAGTYHVKARISDHVSGSVLNREQLFEVRPVQAADSLA